MPFGQKNPIIKGKVMRSGRTGVGVTDGMMVQGGALSQVIHWFGNPQLWNNDPATPPHNILA